MKYTVKAHPTKYNGVQFRSRLEARWACLFDLLGLEWDYEPYDLIGWSPDFQLRLPCGHSECGGQHVLLVEVKPYHSLEQFEGHPCRNYTCGYDHKNELEMPADGAAAFGVNPSVTNWDMVHGGGAAVYALQDIVDEDLMELWKLAGNKVQWKPGRKRR